MLTIEEIARACGAKIEHASLLAAPLNAAMTRFDISNPNRQACFLATVAIESAHLSQLRENLFYRDPARLLTIFPRAFKTVKDAEPYARNPKALAQLLYEGYEGRGLLQLTWRKNYEAAGAALRHDYVKFPDMVEQPEHAALTAAWFWDTNGCNELADGRDMRSITRRVNGPALMHLTERTDMARRAMEWLA
jgi:putative chitinase